MTVSAKLRRMMFAAIPASGYRPESEAEWRKLQDASVELAFEMYRSQGATKAKARALAKAIHGGALGRLLLEIAFSGGDNG